MPNPGEERVLKVYQIHPHILRMGDFSSTPFELDTNDFHDCIHNLAAFSIAKLAMFREEYIKRRVRQTTSLYDNYLSVHAPKLTSLTTWNLRTGHPLYCSTNSA